MTSDASKAAPKNTILYLIIALLSLIILFGLNYMLFWGKGETVRIQSFSPTGEVPQTTNFTITFSREVAPDSLVNQWLGGQSISFSPAVPGKLQWIGRDKLRFYPDVQLLPATEYTAEVTSQLVSKLGFSLRGQRSFQFYTPRFQVNSALVNFEIQAQAAKKADLLATVEFNYPVQPATAVGSITLQYKDGAAIPFQLLTTNPSTIIELKAEQIARGSDESQIELKIARGLKPIGGNTGLEQDFIKPITLPKEEDLKVEKVSPIRETPQSGYIRVQFNLPVDATAATSFISVEPSLKYKISATHQYLQLKGNFQMETTYQISVRKGLKAIDGSVLQRDFSTAVVFRRENIPPQVNFVGDGFYLTKSGYLNIGLATINIEKVHLEVDKIYANNLIYLLNSNELSGNQGYYWYDLDALGKRIHETDLVIQNVSNEEVVTPFNIQKYLADHRVGIFNITAREYDRRWNQASKWVLATDMGIVAKKGGNGLWVWVNSLTKLSPIVGAEINLYSQNNQLLATAKTNNDGLAIFESFQTLAEQFVPFLVTATAGDDFSFLELTRRQIATADFDVDGATYLEHGYNGFLYSERGVYRPGETVHLAAIVRGENLIVPAPFPVQLRVKGPDEKILEEQKATLDEQGSAEFKVTIADYAKTGKYSAHLLIGENDEIGRVNFNVEEFVPDRMKVRLSTRQASYRAGEAIKMAVDAITFFGPPAAGRRVQADVELEAVPFSPAKWKSFSFQNDKISFARMRTDLGEELLDDQGRFEYVYRVPADLEAPSAVRAMLSATVLEPGGRGVTDYRGVIIHPHDAYVGLRMTREGYAIPHQAVPLELVVVDTAGVALANRRVEVTLFHIYWQSILKKVDQQGRYRYVSEEVESEVDRFTITSAATNSTFQVTPDDYGRYRVVAKDVASGASSAISFYASGWGYAPWAMDHPERIEMDLDKSAYLPGEKARLQIRAPFAGKLLLTIEREKIFNYKIVTLKENTATIELPILNGYQPNVYAVAHLIRSTESLERDTPVRAFG
ncbi:MAG: MG2 domain-containing protein, partial [candidate division KSB1 bacterium]|nr:MG2 domain-containing protein [candidate division KSB1 bacterium]